MTRTPYFFSRFSPFSLYTKKSFVSSGKTQQLIPWKKTPAWGITHFCSHSLLLDFIHGTQKRQCRGRWHHVLYLSSSPGVGCKTIFQCSGDSTPRLCKWSHHLAETFGIFSWGIFGLQQMKAIPCLQNWQQSALCWGCSKMKDLLWAWSC